MVDMNVSGPTNDSLSYLSNLRSQNALLFKQVYVPPPHAADDTFIRAMLLGHSY